MSIKKIKYHLQEAKKLLGEREEYGADAPRDKPKRITSDTDKAKFYEPKQDHSAVLKGFQSALENFMSSYEGKSMSSFGAANVGSFSSLRYKNSSNSQYAFTLMTDFKHKRQLVELTQACMPDGKHMQMFGLQYDPDPTFEKSKLVTDEAFMFSYAPLISKKGTYFGFGIYMNARWGHDREQKKELGKWLDKNSKPLNAIIQLCNGHENSIQPHEMRAKVDKVYEKK